MRRADKVCPFANTLPGGTLIRVYLTAEGAESLITASLACEANFSSPGPMSKLSDLFGIAAFNIPLLASSRPPGATADQVQQRVLGQCQSCD